MKLSFALLFVASLAGAQTGKTDRGLVHPVGQARRLALVIGNDAYADNPLHNAVNDARSMKSALEDAGFLVRMSVNATQQQMELVIDEFTGSVNPGDIALFFYAGHGMQISDQNYLIPVDFQARTAVDAKYKAYPAQRVQENLEAAGAAMQIIVLDACRNNPFRAWRGAGDGLAAMQAGRGTYIAFATAPGKTAADTASGQNGLFTGELLAVLREPGLSIDQVFNRVRDQVASKSGGQQLPWSASSLTGEFYFKSTTALGADGKVRLTAAEKAEVRAAFEEGNRLFGQKDYESAVKRYSEIVQLDPGYADAWRMRGISNYWMGKYDRAIPDLSEAISLDPKNPNPLGFRSAAYRYRQEYDKAFTDASEMIRLDPRGSVGYGERAHISCDQQKYDKAIEDFNMAIRLASAGRSRALLETERGDAFFQLKRYDRALQDYNEAIRVLGDRAEYFTKRAAAREALGDRDGADADRRFARDLKK